MRTRAFTACVTVIAVGLLLVPMRAASASSGTHTLRTHTTYTEAGDAPGVAACPGPECGWLETQGTTAYNGGEPNGITGTEKYTLYALPDPRHPGVIVYHGTTVVDVRRSPCGTGGFTEIITHGTTDLTKIDPHTHTIPDHDTWTIKPGSGTGQLVGIRGTGTDLTADGTLTVAGATGDPTASRGVHDGTLTCHLH